MTDYCGQHGFGYDSRCEKCKKLLWEAQFDELAKFNADCDKSKYTEEYLKNMKDMQKKYDESRIMRAKDKGHLII